MKDTDWGSKEILVKCGCGGNHYFEVYYDADSEWRSFWVTFIEYPRSLWDKLEAIYRLLVKDGHVYHGELEIDHSDLERVGAFLVKAGKELKNADKKNKRRQSYT